MSQLNSSGNILIWSILGSTVISTIIGFTLGWVKEFFQHRSLEHKDREKNLYSQLRFHLMLLKITKSTREKLWEDTKNAFNERTSAINDVGAKGDLLMKNLDDRQEFTTKLINQIWSNIDSIKKLLEESSKYIRKDDFPIVEKFFIEHLQREIVTGKAKYEDNSHLFSEEQQIHAHGSIFKVLEELRKKVD